MSLHRITGQFLHFEGAIMRTILYLVLTASLTLCLLIQPLVADDGSLTIGQTFIAGGDDPIKGSTGWALTSHGISQNLYTVDQEGNLVPLLAEDVTRQDNATWELHLKKGIKFSDGSAMTATEVAVCLNRTNAENPISRSSAGKMDFEPIGDYKVKISTERPVPNMAAVLAEWAHVVYKMTAQGPIYTGPYQITELKTGDEIRLSPNPFFPDAEARSDIKIKKFPDAQALTLAFEAKEVDLAFNLPVEALPRLKSQGLITKTFSVAYQYFGFLQTTRAPLDDVRVRQAIDLALDRKLIVKAINAGLPASGAYAGYFPFAPKAPRPCNIEKAKRLLSQAGWRINDGKLREKDGRNISIKLVAYPQRPDLVTMQPVIKSMLAEVGIGCETQVSSAVGKIAKSGDFDMLLYAQNTAPSGDPGFFLNQTFRSQASNNYSRFSSSALDAILDELSQTSSLETRSELALKAQEVLFRDAPAIFLVSPEWHVGLSSKLSTYTPWGSDYYIIRPDLKARP
jgi:peptide/nickel transport system substrate-binding protein